MVLIDPWADSYLHNWIKAPKNDHQILMNLISETVMCAPNLDKTLTK